MHSFEGELLHSAAWSEQTDYHNKKVAVLGCGSSGVQIVPTIQPGKVDPAPFSRLFAKVLLIQMFENSSPSFEHQRGLRPALLKVKLGLMAAISNV